MHPPLELLEELELLLLGGGGQPLHLSQTPYAHVILSHGILHS
jgi:hypothetical protein